MTLDPEFQLLDVNGVRIHAAIQGEGPMVLLLHGFPESWYSWRHQLVALANAGYRAVAIDQRGYGQSSKFYKTDAYRIDNMVADAVGVVRALGESQAVVVGHDWGAPIAWTCAWLHPKVFRGVVGVSVPFAGRGLVALPGSPFGERRPDEYHAELAGPGADFYQTYFGARAAVIDEVETDLKGWLTKVIYTLSGSAPNEVLQLLASQTTVEGIRNGGMCVPHGGGLGDAMLAPEVLPKWLSETDLNFYVQEFTRSGLIGPLSYYANIDASWQFLESQADKPLTPPAFFIGGEYDVATCWGKEAIALAPQHIDNYMGGEIIKGSGHWIQQEYPEQTNALLLSFLKQL